MLANLQLYGFRLKSIMFFQTMQVTKCNWRCMKSIKHTIYYSAGCYSRCVVCLSDLLSYYNLYLPTPFFFFSLSAFNSLKVFLGSYSPPPQYLQPLLRLKIKILTLKLGLPFMYGFEMASASGKGAIFCCLSSCPHIPCLLGQLCLSTLFCIVSSLTQAACQPNSLFQLC